MALGDIKIHDMGGLNSLPSRTYQVAASATLIYPGEPVRVETAAGTATVVKLADGEPTTSTLQVVGIASSTSTNTAAAAGTVEVYMPVEQVTWKCKAKTSTTADTQSEIDAKANDCIVLDLTSTTFTVDFAAVHANTNGIQVVGGDPLTQEIYFKFRPVVTEGAVV